MDAPIVVILAAGEGTRMRSKVAKVLHELCGRPLVQWPVRAALQAGAGRVVVVDSPARALQAVLPDGVELAVQPAPNGTAGAVAAALAHISGAPSPDGAGGAVAADGCVVVLSGDVPLIDAASVRGLIDAHLGGDAAATLLTCVLEEPAGYGRVVRDAAGAVERIVETKAPGDATAEELQIREVNSGVYAFGARALANAVPRLTVDNAQGELYLPQVLAIMRADGLAIAAHAVEDPGLVLNVNDRVSLAQVRGLAQRAIHERHMLAGVTIVDPDTTVIDVDVEIGADTVIEPFTTLKGSTKVGSGCVIRHSFLVDCELQDNVTVGPFAYLRPATLLRAGAKAGTFVEIKNSDIGANAKVPHLSYIGDADVGDGTNLGATTITANYDGTSKHRTTIGRNVHTSVDTTLVAPVSVGDDAYTGAGSVITDDVPAGALGIARERQRNVEGYARRRSGSEPAPDPRPDEEGPQPAGPEPGRPAVGPGPALHSEET